MARSTRYTPANPPVTRSVPSAPRVSTPCRSSNASARACARRVGSGSRAAASAHRPPTDGGPLRLGSAGRPARSCA